jgi:undecaprenyl-diphosphatase
VLESVGWWVTTWGNYEVVLGLSLGYGLVARRLDLRPAALTWCAILLTTWLKAMFAMPRPPGAAVGGYAMPSGHALVSVVAYGSVALLEDDGLGPRALVAATISLAIGTSRIVIGVHHPRDVLAGWLLGASLLAVGLAAWDVVERVPTVATVRKRFS